MLSYWLSSWIDVGAPLNIFRYLTFRTLGALFTAFLLSFLLGDRFILWLKSLQSEGQPIRTDGPESHFTKKGTPTMGGALILLAVTAGSLLWMDIRNAFLWWALLGTLGFGVLGAADDYLKLTRMNTKGVSGRAKLAVQIVLSVLVTWGITENTSSSFATLVTFPFLKTFTLDLGFFFFFWSALVIVGSSNAVNLTDGLDGLAIGPVMIASFCFCLISYLVGNRLFAQYLQLPYIPNVGELSIFLGAWLGAGLGFLWFNAPPAKVFMGDTGSLSAGAALGIVGVATKHECVLAIIGGLFVVEAVSVIVQVAYFKRTRKRIFLMAPIHHHFEKKGWAEPTIVIRFWIISIILALLGLSTLKIR